MKKELTFEFEDNDLKTYIEDNVAIIKFKDNIYNIFTNFDETDKFFSIFNAAINNENIKAIFFINEPGVFGDAKYKTFLKHAYNGDINGNKSHRTKRISVRIDRSREINIISRIIKSMIEADKLFFMGLQGDVVTPFFGVSLAADFRFISQDTTFSISHIKYGLHPSGALPYFLPNYVGYGKAMEILLSDSSISAEKTLSLHLTNQIFPKDNFEKRCLEEIKTFCEIGRNVVSTTKQLLDFHKKQLGEYFEQEQKVFNKEI